MYEVNMTVKELFQLYNVDNDPGTFVPTKEIEVETPFGYKPIKAMLKTQPNPEWVVKTDSEIEGIFADFHRVETKNGKIDKDNDLKWDFLSDLKVGDEINTKEGWKKITECYFNGRESEMYDLEVEGVACFYTNDIISHNTLTLQYLRNQAEKYGIAYRQFKDVKEFMEDVDDYYTKGKKIFVFEDFDAALMERKETNLAPNQILGKVLNTLEGVEEINDVVSIFTTNNVDVFDSAFIRPGRIDKVFTYSLPTKEEYLQFFKAYIPEEEEYFVIMADHLSYLNTDVSYAMLKGICDDINIYKFSNKNLTEKELNDIIKRKVDSANKNKDVKSHSDFIL